MTKEDYLEKCASLINVVKRISEGDYVSPIERLKALKDACDILYYENLQNKTSMLSC